MIAIVPAHFDRKILLLRSERVMLDSDLAALYGVETKALVQAVKRNPARFPPDFMFRLARKLTALEKKYDAQFRVVFDAIRELMTPPSKAKRPIGFERRS